MSERNVIGRRPLIIGLLATTGSIHAGATSTRTPGDQGIGGTGTPQDADDGVGIYGTITGFGSILINGHRVVYPESAAVFIAGRRKRIGDLKVGHVIRIASRLVRKQLTTERVDVEFEVVGPVEEVASADARMTVLGQSVSINGFNTPAIGMAVAVSGLRKPDGTIIATRLDPANELEMQVAGMVTRGDDGLPNIGSLRLTGAIPGGVVGRIRVTGAMADQGFVVNKVVSDDLTKFAHPTAKLSVEGYVDAVGSSIHLGPDIVIPIDPTGTTKLPQTPQHSVLDLSIRGGRLSVDAVHPVGASLGPQRAITPTTPTADNPPVSPPAPNPPAAKSAPPNPKSRDH